MSEIPLFLKLVKAHKLLWAIIVSGNFALVPHSSDRKYNTSRILTNQNLGDIHIKEIIISKQFMNTPSLTGESREHENELYEEFKIWASSIDPKEQNYEQLEISFMLENHEFLVDPYYWFGKEHTMITYELDPINRVWKDKIDQIIIEYPDFEVPMQIIITETENVVAGLCHVSVMIPKSGNIDSLSLRRYYEVLKNADLSKIKIDFDEDGEISSIKWDGYE